MQLWGGGHKVNRTSGQVCPPALQEPGFPQMELPRWDSSLEGTPKAGGACAEGRAHLGAHL